MPHFYPTFPENLQTWALQQSIFYTASAPLRGHHVNISPKGVPSTTFAVLDQNHAAYLDLGGSGAETISHIYENGRVTIMFCSFNENPRILRLYCTGRVVEYDHPDFFSTISRMNLENIPGTRAVILLDIWKVQTSCGYAVPMIDEDSHKAHTSTIENADTEIAETGELRNPPCKCFEDRHMLEQWLVNKLNKNALDEYMVKFNSRSLDGCLGLQAARKLRGEWLWVGATKAWLFKRLDHPEAMLFGIFIGVLLAVLAPVLPVAILRLSSSMGPGLRNGLLRSGEILQIVLLRVMVNTRILMFKLSLVLRLVWVYASAAFRNVITSAESIAS